MTLTPLRGGTNWLLGTVVEKPAQLVHLAMNRRRLVGDAVRSAFPATSAECIAVKVRQKQTWDVAGNPGKTVEN
jgi:hypothetical protein